MMILKTDEEFWMLITDGEILTSDFLIGLLLLYHVICQKIVCVWRPTVWDAADSSISPKQVYRTIYFRNQDAVLFFFFFFKQKQKNWLVSGIKNQVCLFVLID